MRKKWVGVVLLLLVFQGGLAAAFTAGWEETVYVFGAAKPNFDKFEGKYYSEEYAGDITMYNITARVFKRKFFIVPPAESAPFEPHFNESLPLPEDLKEATREIALKSDTYAEFFWNVAAYVNRIMNYTDVVYPEERFNVYKAIARNGTILREDEVFNLIREVWESKQGVCRHYALLAYAMLRYAGVDAVMMGGYGAITVLRKDHRVFYNYKDPESYLRIPYTPDKINIKKFTDLTTIADLVGFGHAWVLGRDPIIGWIPLDPTRMRYELHPLVPINYPESVMTFSSYSPFAESFLPMYDIHIEKTFQAHYIEHDIGNYVVVEAINAGIVFKDEKNNHIEYLRSNRAYVLPKSQQYLFKEKAEEGNSLKVVVDDEFVYIFGLNVPIVFEYSKNFVVEPVMKWGKAWVYPRDRLVFYNEKLLVKTSNKGSSILLGVEKRGGVLLEEYLPKERIPT